MRDHRSARARWEYHQSVLKEIAEEQGNTLGRTGRRLEDTLAAYRALVEAEGSDPQQIAAALTAARDAAWAMVVQRECAGFRSKDLSWLREHWQVPDEVLRLI